MSPASFSVCPYCPQPVCVNAFRRGSRGPRPPAKLRGGRGLPRVLAFCRRRWSVQFDVLASGWAVWGVASPSTGNRDICVVRWGARQEAPHPPRPSGEGEGLRPWAGPALIVMRSVDRPSVRFWWRAADGDRALHQNRVASRGVPQSPDNEVASTLQGESVRRPESDAEPVYTAHPAPSAPRSPKRPHTTHPPAMSDDPLECSHAGR